MNPFSRKDDTAARDVVSGVFFESFPSIRPCIKEGGSAGAGETPDADMHAKICSGNVRTIFAQAFFCTDQWLVCRLFARGQIGFLDQ